MNMNIGAFIFDLDGVLTDTAKYHFYAWKKMANELGIDFDEEDNEHLKGVDRKSSLEWILNKGNTKLNSDRFSEVLDSKNSYYLKSISTLGSSELYQGVDELFAELRNKKIKIGLASASKNAKAVVRSLGIIEQIDYIADSNFIANNKPDPEIFLLAAKGLQEPVSRCVGIEDAIAGIKAINSANMFSVGIGATQQLTEANVVFPAIGELSLDSILDVFTTTT